MSNQVGVVPSLQNQIGAWLVNNKDYKPENPRARADMNRAVQIVWDKLKATGSPPLQSLMNEIESTKKDIKQRFRALARTFSLDPIPVDAAPYERSLEDEGLKIVWNGKPDNFFLFPKDIEDLDSIKKWFADPKNKENCDLILGYSLGEKGLRTLPSQMGQFSQISWLYLYKNRLATIPECLKHLHLLESLYLKGNRIKKIPDFIGDLTQLEYLYLGENQLETIPDTLGKLTKLRVLHLEKNSLNGVPRCVKMLQSLEELFLHNNKIASAEALEGLTSLRNLDLEKNQIREFPDKLETFTRLRTLHLSRNLITEVPSLLGRMTVLDRLQLEGNLIRSLPDFFQHLSNKIDFFLIYFDPLQLIGNPMLFVFDAGLSCNSQSPKELFALQKKFQDHPSKSLLAQFCQKLANADEIDRKGFYALKENDQRLIAEMHPSPKRLFDDLFLFIYAVRKAIATRYDRSTESEKKAVKRILPRYVNIFENVPALIDAMDEVKTTPGRV